MAAFLDSSIEFLKGVGPQKAEALRLELGIHTIGDLLSHYPFRHEDRSKIYQVRDLTSDNVQVQLQGKIIPTGVIGQGPGRRLVAQFSDATGQLELVWFKGISFLEKSIKPGAEYRVNGRISLYKGKANMAHPELELIDGNSAAETLGRALVPVYPLTDGMRRRRLDNRFMAQLTSTALRHADYQLPENIPQGILDKFRLPNRSDAVRELHAPTSLPKLEVAKNRLKFEELFYLQLRHLMIKGNRERSSPGLRFDRVGVSFNTFYKDHLPFPLTGAQKRVIKEIRADMNSGKQMNRLLQGDVGSGKTIVALLTALIATDNGYQVALMAPTEILATQHFYSLQESLGLMPIKMRLLTGSSSKKQREELLAEAEDGRLNLLIGTHALLEDQVKFKQLGLVIVDEQHRFGVAQRAKLWKKGQSTLHVLVMTATPIPRTLAMTVYGDLDVSVIDELPAGRKPVQTAHRPESNRAIVMDFLKKEIALGRQVYYVFPLIEDSDKLELQSLMSGYDTVTQYLPTPQFKYSLVHGRMKAEEKEEQMQLFKRGGSDIMIATTVIEVGVNVPNASVMVIENAERFGLSQLHQLRGRVGRGAEQSYCILLSGPKLSENGRKRLQTMVSTTDGFEIAKVDLELRGPGEIDGTKQSGVLDLKLADIRADEAILVAARTEAIAWLAHDELLMKPESAGIRRELAKSPHRTLWSKIS